MSYQDFSTKTRATELLIAAAGIRLLAKQTTNAIDEFKLQDKAAKVEAMARQNAEQWSTGINSRNATLSNGISLSHSENLSKSEGEATAFWTGQTDGETIGLIVNRYLKTAYVPFLPAAKETSILDTI